MRRLTRSALFVVGAITAIVFAVLFFKMWPKFRAQREDYHRLKDRAKKAKLVVKEEEE